MTGDSDPAVEPIDPLNAKAMIDRGEAVIVDVREPAELHASGIVPGAINIPHRLIASKAAMDSPDRDPSLALDKPVILYCASGKRSELAGNALLDLGYQKVFNLGGLKDWAEAGLQIDEAED